MDKSTYAFLLYLILQIGIMITIKKSLGFGAFDAVPGKLTGIKKYIAEWNGLLGVMVAFSIMYFIVAPLYRYFS